MYHSRVAACDRHLAKGLRDVMGEDSEKEIVVSKRHNDPHMKCYCGKQADFLIRVRVEEKREPGQRRAKGEGVPHAQPQEAIPFPRKKSEW